MQVLPTNLGPKNYTHGPCQLFLHLVPTPSKTPSQWTPPPTYSMPLPPLGPPPPELLQLLLEGAGAVRQPVAARMIEPGHLRGLVPRGAPPADGGGSSEFDSGNPVGPRRHGTCWEVRCTCWSLLGNWTVNAVASQSLLKLHRVSSTAPTHLNKKLSLSLASQAFKCPPGPGRFGCILQAEKWKHKNINKPNTSLLHHKAMTT